MKVIYLWARLKDPYLNIFDVKVQFTHSRTSYFGYYHWRFEIFPNSYYNYLKCRKATYNEKKQLVQNQIKEIFHSENGKMGYRMIKLSLEKQGTNLSLLTVHKYMKALNLKSISLRKRPNYLKGTSHEVFEN